jgi:hypothetical protein
LDAAPFLVIVKPDGRRRTQESLVRGIIESTSESLAKQGITVIDADYKPASRPFHGSYEIVGVLRSADGRRGTLHAYVGVRDRLYVLQTTPATNEDDAAFGAFADSFRLLEPVPAIPPLTIGFTVLDAVLAGLLLWLALFVCRWPPAHRHAGRLALAAVLLAALYVGASYRAVILGTKSVGALDRELGRVAGFAFVAVGGCAILAASQRARRA